MNGFEKLTINASAWAINTPENTIELLAVQYLQQVNIFKLVYKQYNVAIGTNIEK